MTLAFSKQQLSAVWEGGKSGSVHSGWGWYCRATDDRQPQEAFLEQGGTVGSSALLQAVLRKIFPVPAGGKDIIN